MSIRLHAREEVTRKASITLREKLREWRDEHPDMTMIEEAQVLREVLDGAIGTILKFMLRFERHGNYDKPGGEA